MTVIHFLQTWPEKWYYNVIKDWFHEVISLQLKLNSNFEEKFVWEQNGSNHARMISQKARGSHRPTKTLAVQTTYLEWSETYHADLSMRNTTTKAACSMPHMFDDVILALVHEFSNSWCQSVSFFWKLSQYVTENENFMIIKLGLVTSFLRL